MRKCITSGTLTNVRACRDVGGFDDELFIDSVDDDMCYSLQEHGYSVMQVGYVGLLHEIGKATTASIGGVQYAVQNHNALRKYYITRNSVYMIKKHRLNPFVEYFYVYRRFFTVLFFEQNKKEKLAAMVRGVRDGREMAKSRRSAKR